MVLRSVGLGIALASVAGPACVGPAGDEGRDTGAARSPIAGGTTDDATTAVVGFFNVGDGSMCSGTIIAPNAVLTARHCVSPTVNEVGGGVVCSTTAFGELALPTSFFVGTQTTITPANVGELFVREVVSLPGDDDAFCGRDLAILILKDLVSPTVAVPIEPRLDSAPNPGEPYSAVGYGAIDDEGTGSGTRRRRDGLEVDCVGAGCGLTTLTAEEWTGETGVCHGDSGGPALDASGRLLGVTSRGAAGCTHPIYGDAFSRADWLKDTVVYASGVGGYVAPAWTAGSTVDPQHSAQVGLLCEAPSECFTGYCIEQAGTSFCTRPCGDDAPCPEDYECAPLSDPAAGPEGAPDVLVCRLPMDEPVPTPAGPTDDGGCALAARPARGSLTMWWVAVVGLAARRRFRLR